MGQRKMSEKRYEDFYKAFEFFKKNFSVRGGKSKTKPNVCWFEIFLETHGGNFVVKRGCFVLTSTTIRYKVFDYDEYQSLEAGTESDMYEAMKIAYTTLHTLFSA